MPSTRKHLFVTCMALLAVLVWAASARAQPEPSTGVPRLALDITAHYVLGFSPDGKQLGAFSSGVLQAWDTSTGKRIWLDDPHSYRHVAFSSDGRRMVICRGDDGIQDFDKQTKAVFYVWDFPSHKLVQTITHTYSAVACIALSADGKRLAADCNPEGMFTIWDTETGKLVKQLEAGTNRNSALAITPDGKRLIFNDLWNKVFVWDVETEKQLHAFPTQHGTSELTVSPDGKRLAVPCGESGEGRLYLFDLEAGKPVPLLDDVKMEFGAAAFSPDSKLLVASAKSDDEGIVYKIWNLPAGKLVRQLVPDSDWNYTLGGIAFSPDGKTLATGAFGRTDTWDVDLLLDADFQKFNQQIRSLGGKLAWRGELLELDFSEGGDVEFPTVGRPFALNLKDFSNLTDDDLAKIARHKNLVELSLANCRQVTDVGMVHVAKMKKLKRLDCTSLDQLTPAGVVQLTELKQLESLSLSGTSIAPEALLAIGKFRQLKHLDISSNSKITDQHLSALSDLPQLESLNVGNTQINGSGLALLAKSRNLAELNVWNCTIGDAGFQALTRFPQLKRLSLEDVSANAARMAQVAKLPQLEFLSLPYDIDDEGLAHVGKLTKLRYIPALKGEAITDRGLLSLNRLTSLDGIRYINLPNVKGHGFAALANSKLTTLDLRECGLTDEGLAGLKAFKQLRDLRLPGNITDAGLVHISGLENLRVLDLNGRGITDAGLVHLTKLLQLRDLDLYDTAATETGRERLKEQLPNF